MSTNCWAGELLLNMQIFRHLLHERDGCKILQWTKCWLNNFEPQCCEWGWSLSKDSLHDFCKMFWSWIATQGSPKVSHWKCRWTVAKHESRPHDFCKMCRSRIAAAAQMCNCRWSLIKQWQSLLLWLSVLLILVDCKTVVATLSKGSDEAVLLPRLQWWLYLISSAAHQQHCHGGWWKDSIWLTSEQIFISWYKCMLLLTVF